MSWNIANIPDLSGKVAVVTGANGGLGFESAKALAGAGAHVVMAARNQTTAHSARDDILAVLPDASLEIVELDLGSLESVRQAAGTITDTHPAVDILMNNAGVMAMPEGRTVRRVRNPARHRPSRPLGSHRTPPAPATRRPGCAGRHRHLHRPPLRPGRRPGQPQPARHLRAVESVRAGETRQLPLRPRPAPGVPPAAPRHSEPVRASGFLQHQPASPRRRRRRRRPPGGFLARLGATLRHGTRRRGTLPAPRRHRPDRPQRRDVRTTIRQQRAAREKADPASGRSRSSDRHPVEGVGETDR